MGEKVASLSEEARRKNDSEAKDLRQKVETLTREKAALSESASRSSALDVENKALRAKLSSLAEESSLLSMPEEILPASITALSLGTGLDATLAKTGAELLAEAQVE